MGIMRGYNEAAGIGGRYVSRVRGYGNDRTNYGRGSSNRGGAAGGGEGSVNISGNKSSSSDDQQGNVFLTQRCQE